MPRKARIHFVSLHSSLVNLPISIYGPLLEKGVRPQNLAVHLTLVTFNGSNKNAKVEAYVGWTGMASASSLAHFNSQSGEGGFETLEIDPQYAQGLGLSQGDVVEIGLLHDLPMAKMVSTEPLTSDDWEIIEIHASHVESTLLSQVRVAKIGQEIDVWVMGRTRVRLLVTSLDPTSKNNALLLTTNTEVSIAPKLHRDKPAISPQKLSTNEQTTTSDATAASSNKTHQKASYHILRVLPSRAIKGLPTYSGSELVAFVSPITFTRIFASKSLVDLLLTKDLLCYNAKVKKLSPPVDPSSPPNAPPTPSATPRVLTAGAATGDKDKDTNAAKDSGLGDIFVGSISDLPDSHIIFPVSCEGIEDWDLVRLSSTSESESLRIQWPNPHSELPASSMKETVAPFLAGVDEILNRCIDYGIRQFVYHASTNVVLGVSGLLVTGRTGAGKTSIVRTVSKALQENPKTFTYSYYVDLSRYVEQPVGTVKALFNYWFDKVAWHRPSVLILDNLDKLLGAEVEHADSFKSRQLTEIFLTIYSASAKTAALNSRGILVLGTATSTNALHPLINSAHIFKEIANVKPPNKDARRDILSRIVQDRLAIASDIQLDDDLNFTALAMQTEGYSAMDLQDLAARAVHQVAIRMSKDNNDSSRLTPEDFAAAQTDFVPLSLRDVKLQKSDVAWSDIGGLQETRKILRETLEWPTKYGPIFAQSPLRLRSGLLLYGFPGCGKTLLASAVAKECGLNFISVKGPEILNKYIGASEKSVRDLFERASAAKPCVLFFDEFDSIAPKRGHDSTGVTDRVVNQMLTQMDGAEGLDGVYVLAATSRPDLIDSALLRPGRLDKSLLCNMPDPTERKDILIAVGRKMSISPSVDWDNIAEATDGFSGADLQALLYNAHLEVIHASIAANPIPSSVSSGNDDFPIEYATIGGSQEKKVISKAEEMALQRRLRQIRFGSNPATNTPKEVNSTTRKKAEIEQKHILSVLKTMRPSVSLEERVRLNRIYQGFVSDRSGELPVPPESGGVGNRVSLM